jgi:hypothetical protein
MKSRLTAVVLLVLAAVAVVVAESVWPVRAQEGRAQRWEYCYLGKPSLVDGPQPGGEWAAQVHYFTAQGGRVETVRRTGPRPDGDRGWAARIQAIARLGTEGWELVTSQGDEMIFKRRLP